MANLKYYKQSTSSGLRLVLISSSLILVLFLLTDFQRVDSGQRYTIHDSLVNKSDNISQSPVPRTPHLASLNPETCITHDEISRTVTITCRNASISDIDKVLNDSTLLKNEGSGVWFLNSNLSIAEGANFTIDSRDSEWLKINSTTSETAYHIEVLGNVRIDSVKISSWNSTSDDYTKTDGNIHRASIAVPAKATGTAHVSNSELAYLGYDASPYQGLSYYGGDGAIIKNNTIHDMWYGFYSNGRADITIEDNNIHDNLKNGLYPRVGTHDMVIRNNFIHNNGGLGIACSLDCKNITIEANEIYGNKIGGVLLSRNVMNSIVKNNTVHDEIKGLVLSESNNNELQGNRISDTDVAIEAKDGSSQNTIHDNFILNPGIYAINIVKQANQNKIENNNISNSAKDGICVRNNSQNNTIIDNIIIKSERDGICISNQSSDNLVKSNIINGSMRNGIRVSGTDSNNNTFNGNEIHRASIGILADNNSNSMFLQNTIDVSNESEYSVSKKGFLMIQKTNFSSDKISATGKNESLVNIHDSGIIIVKNNLGNNQTTINSNENAYLARLVDSESITVTSIK
jgi:poly(beta-D-mannuronate) C5 epimerase